ncbi:YibE/F family protein [Corynebacterium sp. 153RC1]|uniref:YibE/F family protein n=1 Tax=unclassified Corynebacterium TaxID=2624378 RepID=UPI00211C86EF|nr:MULTISPECIES: YibE/F family protein [unclassified Corynebacterium]MCQ9353494.1 YibE/F family protein [Corynebacterium sp. 209RC1]MCQ9355187.1 YibE/F family protein [Corynebacterium sp. 1222RC1]MCQ9357312.1 YibE/F family protein [Corynebacterium sp. 122RC1]MCQ9359488.1 YibE/F family protein [Corynebacterium sp. 142RC1]MCQ9361712.1 YibE/F family protein [Corynebacterium sp. 153RC1]
MLSRRILSAFLLLSALATVVGTFLLWPRGEPNVSPNFAQTFSLGQEQVQGEVVAVTPGACNSDAAGSTFSTSPKVSPGAGTECTWNIVEIAPETRTLIINHSQPGEPDLQVGDSIKMLVGSAEDGSTRYAFADYERTSVLLMWGALIAAALVVFALWRGVRALIGLTVTLAIVAVFVLPAIVRGTSPLAIAIVGGALILTVAVPLVHGLTWKAWSALGGTLMALGVAAVLAHLAIDSTHLRGLADEDNLQLLLYLPDVSITGLMLCGFIIGALGVMNDVTIAQASTVAELAERDPHATPTELFRGAMSVGRDHISSMVYTLVLTYTGASLPMLLLLSIADRPLGQTLTSDIMATELLRSGIGALALTLAVPLATALAAFTVPERTSRTDAPSAPHPKTARGRHRSRG